MEVAPALETLLFDLADEAFRTISTNRSLAEDRLVIGEAQGKNMLPAKALSADRAEHVSGSLTSTVVISAAHVCFLSA
jgi:hypothetical protein